MLPFGVVENHRSRMIAAAGLAAVALLSACASIDAGKGSPAGHAGASHDASGGSASTVTAGGASLDDSGFSTEASAGSGGRSGDGARHDVSVNDTGRIEDDAALDRSVDGAAMGDAQADAPQGKVTHRVLSSASDQGPLAIVSKNGQIEWQYDALALGGEANDAWLLPNGDVVFSHKSGARELTPAKQVVWSYAAPAGSEVHSCQPLAGGRYLLGEAHDGGLGYLREVDSSGKVLSTVTINAPSALPAHGQFREVRKTPQGTYLVTYLQINKAMEFDAQGKPLRTFACGSFVAIRLPDGNTLISCGDAHRVIEVDSQDNIVWEVTETEIAGNRVGFAAGLQRLANGNTVICNWPGHFATDPHEPQAFELTRDKELVWELSDPRLKWTSNIEVLDPEAQVDGVSLR
jgi:hypothetical protein